MSLRRSEVGSIDGRMLDQYEKLSRGSAILRVDAQGRWVSPGIVDLHSHLGVYSVPMLQGTLDVNSRKGPVLPWLRALDAFNTHDDALPLSVSGGVTVHPSDCFILKLVYSNTHMDTVWAFRQGYKKARQIKEAQDEYCAKATGRGSVHTHCYETVDLDDLVRISNEFKFSIAAFHHAHETYLVPDTLKSAYGTPPAAALFVTHSRYKCESYCGSEFAPRILADNGLRVVLKSDHLVLDSRFLLWEAQQAYYYGLPHNLALAAVTSTPASVMGQDHRIGYIKDGYDADLVLWDSHPLALGATPQQVWIDGIPQLSASYTYAKPNAFQHVPKVPNFDEEAKETLQYDGLPPLEPKSSVMHTVVFANVSRVFVRANVTAGIEQVVPTEESLSDNLWAAVVKAGRLVCVDSTSSECVQSALRSDSDKVEVVDLEGGSISPGLTSFGSPLGLEEISGEASTRDGSAPDGLAASVPSSEVERDLALVAPLRFTLVGAQEAHLLAMELGEAGVGLILTQPRPFPQRWDAHRILPGPPLSEKSQIVVLLEHNVTIGLGTDLADEARNTRFDAAWAALEADGSITKAQALALVSGNVERLLGGAQQGAAEEELIVTHRGDLLGYGKVVGAISPSRGLVDLL